MVSASTAYADCKILSQDELETISLDDLKKNYQLLANEYSALLSASSDSTDDSYDIKQFAPGTPIKDVYSRLGEPRNIEDIPNNDCYALHSINSLPYKDTFNILSLGCGASPDLAAFENYLSKNNFCIPVNYLDIDINPLWNDKHNFIKDYFKSTSYNPEYICTDVFEIFKDHYTVDKNLLILQYLISHFYNTGKLTAVNEFYKNLIQNVIKRMQPKSIIIINDVNSNRRGRDLFLRFSDTLSKYGIRHTYSCRYFEYNIQNEYQRYGIKYPSKDILTWPTPNLARYNPWTVCSSAQLIIELE